MLLRFVALFLAFIMVRNSRFQLTEGWGDHEDGPKLGGIYWIAPSDLQVEGSSRIHCIVFLRVEVGDPKLRYYRVARIRGDSLKDEGLSVLPFFQDNLYLKTALSGSSSLARYRILPHEIYEVSGTPETMKLYDNTLTCMGNSVLDTFLEVVSMVDGWGTGQRKPLPGGVYWIRPQFLGLEVRAEIYRPCVVIRQVGNKYLVITMSALKLPDGHRATEFFMNDPKVKTVLSYLMNFYIYPRKTYEVEGDPKILQRWKKLDFLKMPGEGLSRLVMVSGMVDGWNARQHGPLLGHVYWISPRVFGLKAKAGIYIPCVVLELLLHDKKYRVVGMSVHKRPNRYLAADFFGNGEEDLQTGIPITGLSDLKKHYIYPHKTYDVEGNPKNLQKWGNGHSLEIRGDGLSRLVTASEMVDGWNEGQRPLFGGVYWIPARFFETEAKAGVYVPCVVLMHQNENECRVVKMFDSPPSHGPNLPAWQFLVPGADIIHLVNYFIHPHKNCNIKCDRTIMQNWGGGVITHMREDHAKILMASVSSGHYELLEQMRA